MFSATPTGRLEIPGKPDISREGPLEGFLARGAGQVEPSALVGLLDSDAEQPVFKGISAAPRP